MKVLKFLLFISLFLLLSSSSCSEGSSHCADCPPIATEPTPFTLVAPSHLPPITQPENLNFTVEGIALGQKLFKDPILSADNSIACQSCHLDEFGLTDGLKVSKGINNQEVSRNSMPLFNLIYEKKFFWDGRSPNLLDQIFHPIRDPREMGNNWENVAASLKNNADYVDLFQAAFPNESIDSNLVASAIAQYVFTLFSPMTKYDSSLFVKGFFLDDDELEGLELFLGDNVSRPGGDCFHCHDLGNNLFTDHIFRNNGITEAYTIEDFPDPGVGGVTKNTSDYGKFKTPSLRMVSKTGPYMHDGRFSTLEEVVKHYNEGIHPSINTNPSELEFQDAGGVFLTEEQQKNLVAFLKTL